MGPPSGPGFLRPALLVAVAALLTRIEDDKSLPPIGVLGPLVGTCLVWNPRRVDRGAVLDGRLRGALRIFFKQFEVTHKV
jgi:hypothetical protein